MGPTLVSISDTTSSMRSKWVTSSTRPKAASASDSKSRFASSLLAVPTTVWPAASASCASARPNPLLTPVIRKTLLNAMMRLQNTKQRLHTILAVDDLSARIR
ncbi:hypothetical protein D3C87_1795830 [compost metagenome]